MSKTQSKTRPRKISSAGFGGGGIRSTMASRISSMPIPIFALASIASSAGMARISSSCLCTAGNVGVRQIDLVDHRDDGEPLFVREMHIRDRLRLDALRGVDDEQRAFAGRERARNFIREIDVPRRIEQIEPVFFSRLRGVTHRDRVCLDRDPALAFEIHRIEQLILLVALVDCARPIEQSIRERCLPVIDMRDDAEIPGQLDRHKALHYAGASSVGQSGGVVR